VITVVTVDGWVLTVQPGFDCDVNNEMHRYQCVSGTIIIKLKLIRKEANLIAAK